MYDRYLTNHEKECMISCTNRTLNVTERKVSLGHNLSGFAFLLMAAQFDIALAGKAEICNEGSYIWQFWNQDFIEFR